jgi:hypothetical protein
MRFAAELALAIAGRSGRRSQKLASLLVVDEHAGQSLGRLALRQDVLRRDDSSPWMRTRASLI